VQIVYRPSSLSFEEFHDIDIECFPGEPLGSDSFDSCVQSDFWAAMIEERCVGYGYLKVTPELAWIARIGVRATERNQGIGARLMEVMLEYCRSIPRHTVILYVQQDNPAAIHLYEKHGFSVADESYQYIVPVARLREDGRFDDCLTLDAIPVSEMAPELQPTFPTQWSDLAGQHDPPGVHVLVFRRDDGQPVGYCRLCPGFPGCFPFELSSPDEHLAGAIKALEPCLSPDHSILKLTFASAAVAQACDALELELNYRLYKMITRC
jgi:ribosomal protein S18 acetylase RimI-like enzyme